ncbi:MAG: hypothetical protein EU533_06705, partial [Promethearchaeota archaeon]
MEEQRFKELVTDLNEFKGVEEMFLLDSDGNIAFKSSDFELDAEEAKTLLNSWKEKAGSLNFQGNRFAILKNDEIQLA